MTTEQRRAGPGLSAPTRKSKGSINLLIVDEHPVLRAGVRTLLQGEADVEVVAEAQTIDEAVDMCRASAPDVVLMDVAEASAGTLEGMRRLRREAPDIALVVLARRDDDEEVYRAVVGGAAGHVGETAHPNELVDTIKQAAAGREPIQRTLAERPAVGRRVLEAFAEMAGRRNGRRESDVSERELRILDLAARGQTNYQIGRALGVSEHTVKSAISQLLGRLGLRHRTEAVVHALRRGWIDSSAGAATAPQDAEPPTFSAPD